jgi:hypothetical protein
MLEVIIRVSPALSHNPGKAGLVLIYSITGDQGEGEWRRRRRGRERRRRGGRGGKEGGEKKEGISHVAHLVSAVVFAISGYYFAP